MVSFIQDWAHITQQTKCDIDNSCRGITFNTSPLICMRPLVISIEGQAHTLQRPCTNVKAVYDFKVICGYIIPMLSKTTGLHVCNLHEKSSCNKGILILFSHLLRDNSISPVINISGYRDILR